MTTFAGAPDATLAGSERAAQTSNAARIFPLYRSGSPPCKKRQAAVHKTTAKPGGAVLVFEDPRTMNFRRKVAELDVILVLLATAALELALNRLAVPVLRPSGVHAPRS